MIERRDPTVALLGVAVGNLTMQDVLDAVDAYIAEGGFHQIATANVDFLVNAANDEELRETLGRCDIVLADGMPLVWASRFLGNGLEERVAGADLLPRLAKLSAERGYRIFMLGATEESSVGATAWMQKNCPGVCIAGRFCPARQPLETMDHELILHLIEDTKPDILLVAFGNPKQEKWLTMHRHRLKVPVCIGMGGSFDLLSGKLSRAPMWMQRSSLEWVYRTIQEPTRLARRYASDVIGLLRYLPIQMIAMAVQVKGHTQAQISIETAGTVRIFRIHGDLTGSMLPQFERDVSDAMISGLHVVLDASAIAYFGVDALGVLIHLQTFARRWKRELWFAGLSPLLRWVVVSALLDRSLRVASRVAEALRRIEPELGLHGSLGSDWAVCRIGGRMIPIHAQEIADVHNQLQQMLKLRAAVEPLSAPPSESAEDRFGREILAVDAG